MSDKIKRQSIKEITEDPGGSPRESQRSLLPDPAPLTETPGPPRIRSVGKSATKCIYFADARMLDELERVAGKHGRGSCSNIITQLVRDFLIAHKLKPTGARSVLVEKIEVYL